MDGKSLLKMALDKITPDKANEILENSGLLFTVGGVHVKFVNGHLEDESGQVVNAAMSSITGIKTEEEVEKAEADRRSLAENSGQSPEQADEDQKIRDAEAARLQAEVNQNRNLSTTHTLLGGGVSRTVSQTKDGTNVVGGQVTGDQFGKQENIATSGLGTGAGMATANMKEGTVNAPAQSGQQGDRTFQPDGQRAVTGEGQTNPDEAKKIQEDLQRRSEEQKAAAKK